MEITSLVPAEVHCPRRFIESYTSGCYVAMVLPNSALITM